VRIVRLPTLPWFIVIACVAWPASAQVVNPSGVAFTCPDHDQDTEHEIDIVRDADGVVIATVLGGDPPVTTAGEVVITLNVQPIAFGDYRFIARAVAGGLRSVNSAPSAIWHRRPGAPTGVRAR